MTDSTPPNSGISHLSAFVLTTITILCVVLIGVTGIVKYQLDRSEIALAAPDVSFTPQQDIYDMTMRALGYGGFLEAANRVIMNRDRGALGSMKLHLKTAQDNLAKLSEKSPAAVRHDMQGLVDIYAAIYAKAAQSFTDQNAPFTSADLYPALAALPALDTRLQAAIATNRMKAQEDYRFWGLSLTLIAWCSLLMAAAMAAGVYLVYRNRQAAPLRALAQSIENLSRGDMQTPIWGMHRKDAIGELARAVDLARYHFSHLPDLSLMSDQGPVRLQFEGETRSIFQAMMRQMTDEFERARSESTAHAGNFGKLDDTLTGLATRLNAVMSQLQVHDTEAHDALQRLVNRINDSNNAFTQVQERTVAQMNQLVPYLKDRAHNMAEVTHIAGTQITQSLENLIKVEEELRNSAGKSKDVVEQFIGSTNQMGERLFASANLMQASSKLLSETTDTVQSRFNEAVETLGKGEVNFRQIMDRVEERVNKTTRAEENMAAFVTRAEENLVRMEGTVRNMSERHDQLSEQVVLATHRMESVVASFEGAQRAMSEATQNVKHDGEMVSNLLQELRTNNDQLLTGITQNSQAGYATLQALAERSQRIMQDLESQVRQQAQTAETRISEFTLNTQTLGQQVQSVTLALAKATTSMNDEQERFATARTNFADSVDRIGAQLQQQAMATINKADEWAAQNFIKLEALTTGLEALMQRVSILGQLTGTLGTVAGQLGQIVPTLGQGGTMRAAPSSTGDAPPLESFIEEMQEYIKEQWIEATTNIEAMHDHLAQMIVQQKDQLETRIVVMDKKLRAAGEQNGLDDTQRSLMNEIVLALGKISDHLMMLDESIQHKIQRQA